jgi:hypothetical protein
MIQKANKLCLKTELAIVIEGVLSCQPSIDASGSREVFVDEPEKTASETIPLILKTCAKRQ